jgi:hypothetical protein
VYGAKKNLHKQYNHRIYNCNVYIYIKFKPQIYTKTITAVHINIKQIILAN